ncbi:MAG: acyl carrier protein [Bacilli bacterium]|nr:acyl carrier protein [Bacilli bacterium]
MAVSSEQVINSIKERLGIKEIDRDATIATYGLDSLDVMEYLMDLETEYGISFDSEETKSLKTIGDLIDLIQQKVK